MKETMKEVSKNIRMTPERIAKLLKMEDIILSEAEATQLLIFLKKMARITVAKRKCCENIVAITV